MKPPAANARALDAEASATEPDDLGVEPDADLDSDGEFDSDTEFDSDAEFGSDVEHEAGPAEAAKAEPAALSERERQILAFERKWWKHAGSKEQAIRDEFDLSATRYYQLLNGLLDNPAALANDPVLIGRLRRIRSTRARTRRR